MINDLALNNQRHEIPEWPQTLQPRNKHQVAREVCSKGHMMTPENTIQKYKGTKKMGQKDGVDCRACANALKRKYYHENKARIKAEKTVADAKLKGLPIPDLEELVKKDALAYLMASGQVGEAEEKLNLAIEESYEKDGTLPPCYKNPGPYQDYDERNPPSPVQAAILCGDCPFKVANACGAYASVLRPTNGVWNGTRWREQKVGVGEPVVGP